MGLIYVKEPLLDIKKTVAGIEESVLNHFIVCKEMFRMISSMVIDEEGKYVLTKYSNKSGSNTQIKKSDHLLKPRCALEDRYRYFKKPFRSL